MEATTLSENQTIDSKTTTNDHIMIEMDLNKLLLTFAMNRLINWLKNDKYIDIAKEKAVF